MTAPMILVGQLDSPFVRRVAIALHHYRLPFERRVISAYDDFDALLALNPLGTVPALQLEDGTVLTESHLILDHLDRLAGPQRALLPADPEPRARLLAHLAVAVGLAEKAVSFRTETVRRPAAKQVTPHVDRLRVQIAATLGWLEAHTRRDGFIAGDALTHADIASAVAMTFIANKNPEHLAPEDAYPRLLAHRERCEALDAFAAAPFGEG